MKKIALTSALVSAVAALPAANAFDVKLSGQANKAVMITDDGNSTETSIVDNNLSSTRFTLEGEQLLDNGLTASVLFSADMISNNSAALTQASVANQATTPTATGGTLTEAFSRVGLSGDWGALFIGYQDTATDDAMYRDLGAAGDVMNAGVGAFAGGFNFKDSTGANVTVGTTNAVVKDMLFGFDGTVETENSIRYNSPEWNGFNGSASISQGGDVDTNIRYAKDYGTFAVDAALGMAVENSQVTGAGNAESTLYSSASVKHESGLAGTLGYMKQKLDGAAAGIDEPEGLYAKVSYAWDNYGVGVDYAKFKNALGEATDHEITSYGVAGQVDLGSGVSAGALFRNYALDATGVSAEDINVFALNMRVQF